MDRNLRRCGWNPISNQPSGFVLRLEQGLVEMHSLGDFDDHSHNFVNNPNTGEHLKTIGSQDVDIDRILKRARRYAHTKQLLEVD